MSSDGNDLVTEYVLGLLTEDRRRQVLAALDRSPDLAEEIRLAGLAVSTIADGLPMASAPANGRARLLATLASPERFRAYFPVLRRWFDLGDEALPAVLARIDAGRSWIDAPFPGVRYFHFEAGPAALAKESGVLSLAPGALFPHHLHHGGERSMILEGSLVLDGIERHVGTVIEAPAGSTHDFVAGPGRELVLIVGHDGVSFSV